MHVGIAFCADALSAGAFVTSATVRLLIVVLMLTGTAAFSLVSSGAVATTIFAAVLMLLGAFVLTA